MLVMTMMMMAALMALVTIMRYLLRHTGMRLTIEVVSRCLRHTNRCKQLVQGHFAVAMVQTGTCSPPIALARILPSRHTCDAFDN